MQKSEKTASKISERLDWISTQPQLDSQRVAVIGGSYGGYMVLASLTHYGNRLKAGIDEVGIANFITFLERTSAYRQDLRRIEYGDERDPQMRSVFERINPTARADKIQANLMVVHGRNDPRVPLFESQQIAEKSSGSAEPSGPSTPTTKVTASKSEKIAITCVLQSPCFCSSS